MIPKGGRCNVKRDADKRKRETDPSRVIALSFLAMIAAGTLLFLLPCMTRGGKGLAPMEALFTATSSVCVTGLTMIDPVLKLTGIGQVLLLCLIEVGGLSMVTFATFFIFLFKKRSGFRSLRLAQEYTNLDAMSQVKPLVRTIILTTGGCQLFGALVLCLHFVPQMGLKGAWVSLFTAVSAYCNAGFDLFGTIEPFGSLQPFNGTPLVMYTVMALIVTGGLGFYVFYDLLTCRKTGSLSLHTRTVGTFVLLLILYGFVHVFTLEYNNPATLGPLPLSQKITAALFQSITTRTAGFASVDMNALRDLTKFGMILLMFIGAGSGSTGGGVKITTFAVLVMSIVSVLTGKKETVIFRRRVDHTVVNKALAVSLLGMLVVYLTSFVLLLDTPDAGGVRVLFEAVSAFSTAGLSCGVTASCGAAGHLALVFAMFIGRIGPVCFVVSLGDREEMRGEEVLPEGRIMVG